MKTLIVRAGTRRRTLGRSRPPTSFALSECFSRKTHSCFTLIELLVVIGIIAVLASLLLPALATAKAQGQKAVCIGNQKQIHIALMLYVDDNDTWLPDNYHWLCDKYFGGGGGGPPAGTLKGLGLLKTVYIPNEILYCPGQGWEYPTGYWFNRQAGYCYFVKSNYAEYWPGTNKPNPHLPDNRRVPMPEDWIPLNACRIDGGKPLPHGNTGVVILRRDGSVFFLTKPWWGGWGFSWAPTTSAKNWDPFSLLWVDERIRM